jgi:DNA-binding GntR family transcriptional regulator
MISPPPAKTRASEPLSRKIARQLSDAIEGGGYRPGQRLSEEDIAAAHGVSRGPVREALALLVQEGLAVQIARRGVHVIDFTPEQIGQVYQVRAVLYGLALRTFVQSAPADMRLQFAQAREANWAGRSVEDLSPEDCAAMGFALTKFVLENCGSVVLRDAYWRTARRVLRYYAPLHYRTVDSRRAYRDRSLMLATAVRLGEAAIAEQIGRAIVAANADALAETFSLATAQKCDDG